MSLKHFLRKQFRRIGYDAVDVRRFDRAMGAELSWDTHDRLLRHLLEEVLQPAPGRSLSFLQIGANDGIKDNFTGKVLERQDVRIVLVEPDPSCAKVLDSRFASAPNVVVVQKALAASDAEQNFFFFECTEEKGIQLNVFSSFDRKLLEEKKRTFGLEARIEARSVACTTLKSIGDGAGIERWDVVVSDIEGFDHEVVRQVCAGARDALPRLFVFEHAWLTPSVRKDCYDNLAERGYAIVAGAQDTIALMVD